MKYDFETVLDRYDNGSVKWIIHRRHDNHAVFRLCEGQNAVVEGVHHPGSRIKPLWSCLPSISALRPSGYSLIPGRLCRLISQHRSIQIFL